MTNDKPRGSFCRRTRREFLSTMGGGFTSLALAGMLGSAVKLVPRLWHSYRGAQQLFEVPDTIDRRSEEAIAEFLADHPPRN